MWRHYLSITGSMCQQDFDRVLQGWPATSTDEHNLVVQTLNEHLLGHGERYPLPYLRAQDPLPHGPTSGRQQPPLSPQTLLPFWF